MPLLQSAAPTVKSVVKSKVATTQDSEFKSAVTDSREQSFTNLLTNIGGSKWIVDYFQQLLGSSDELMSYDPAKDAVYQQYKRISNLELRVESPLTQSQDTTSNEFDVSGDSTLYPGIIPNVGDVFIADIGDGRKGLFTVTETTRLTILKETCYTIQYRLVDYVTTSIELDLKRKTVSENFFVKKLLAQGDDPVVVTEDYNNFLSMDALEALLLERYLVQFYDRRVSTLLVPVKDGLCYDPFVVKAISAFIPPDKHKYLRDLKIYSLTIPDVLEPVTVWDCLLDLKSSALDLVSREITILDSSYFGTRPQFGGVYYSDITDVVYPLDKLSTLTVRRLYGSSRVITKELITQFPNTQLDDFSTLDDINVLPIKPIGSDSSYLFSAPFYRGDKPQMSKLELLTYTAIDKLTIDRKDLITLCEQLKTWGPLEQFYYTPVLLLLIKMVKHGL